MGITRGWEKRVIRTNIRYAKRTVRLFSVSPQSRSLFSASFHTFCLTARAYLNTQKYGLFCSLIFFFAPSQVTVHGRTFSKSVQFAPIIHTSWTSSIALSILCARFAKRIPRNVKLFFRINKYFQCKRKIAHKILIYTESIFAQKKINPSGQRLWGSVFFFSE